MKYEEVKVNSERWFDLTPLLNEEFRDIKETNNKYQISNYGRIKSKKNNIILSTKNSKGWYLTNAFYLDDKRVTLRPHRLVGKYFISNPNNYHYINHKDMNKQNNRVDNLEWCTQSHNVKDAIQKGANTMSGFNKYNKEKAHKKYGYIYQYDMSMKYINKHYSPLDASKTTGVCCRNILQVINHQEGRIQAGGYIWLCESEVVNCGIKI